MLALSPVPEEGAGCRFRVVQYVPALESAGVHVTISPFFTTDFFRLVYRRGHALKKTLLFAERAVDRFRTLMARERYDAIFIYREALPIGPAIVESLFARAHGLALIYDFDDAVYLPNTSEANRAIAALKWPRKVKSIVGRSDCVIAGNEYLAAWARAYSDTVRVIPTCVDTTKFVPRAENVARAFQASGDASGGVPTIGWIGTPTTVPYLLSLQSVFQDIARTHQFVLRICGAGADVQMPGVKVSNVPWALDTEVSLFNTCDIGVYPLSDDEWARGKCGFKAIQFMACGVPVVAAPVGVNREILRDGVNGLLAASPAEWVEKLGRLLASLPLRATLGAAGRATIEAEYSLKVNAPKVVAAVHDAVERARRRAAGAAPVPVGASRS
jgi:glycosyltransferase involved in cell wall biosynthesis